MDEAISATPKTKEANKMNEFDSKTVRISLNQNADMQKLKTTIEKKGGKHWNSKGNRVYFVDDANLAVARLVFAQPYSCYLDLDTKEFVFDVNANDYSKQKNTDAEYKTAYVNTLR